MASDKIELSHVEPLQDRIPLHVLNSRQKDPAVDKLNVIEERLAIQKRIVEKRKKIASVIPQVNVLKQLNQCFVPSLGVTKCPEKLGQLFCWLKMLENLICLYEITGSTASLDLTISANVFKIFYSKFQSMI